MSGMTSERLAEIREDHGNASDDTGLTYSMAADQWHVVCDKPTARFLMWAHRDLADLLAHVDHLTADNARLRAGIEALHRRVRNGNYCWHCDHDWPCESATLLNPPTGGETDE